jgi:GMP synthase-like glutamine amidotransferase
VILYVVTDTLKSYRESDGWFRTQKVLERLSGDVCLTLHFTRMKASLVRDLRPTAIVHSGGGTDYKDYDVLKSEPYRRAVVESDVAQIGLCGGHQILATFFGSRIGPIRRLRPGEPDPAGYRPGYFKEWGVYSVRILRRDPIFAGLGRHIRVQEYHYWKVKALGPALKLLAGSRDCRVQAFVHRHRPVYGTQFHPEAPLAAYPDGAKLLRNFFRIAREHSRSAGRGRLCESKGPKAPKTSQTPRER